MELVATIYGIAMMAVIIVDYLTRKDRPHLDLDDLMEPEPPRRILYGAHFEGPVRITFDNDE